MSKEKHYNTWEAQIKCKSTLKWQMKRSIVKGGAVYESQDANNIYGI